MTPPAQQVYSSKRRVVVDSTLLLAGIGAIVSFVDLRATVKSDAELHAALSRRVEVLETQVNVRDKDVATKDDIRRLESRVDEIYRAISQRTGR